VGKFYGNQSNKEVVVQFEDTPKALANVSPIYPERFANLGTLSGFNSC
jgi:hypothetical protein